MGFYSWKTADTQESIPNIYAERDQEVSTFTVYMLSPDGRKWKEEAYEGYGKFGGQDIYLLIAELNGLVGKDEEDLRNQAIAMVFDNNPSGDFETAAARGIQVPKLVEREDVCYEDVGFPLNCKYQGYFYYRR